MADFTTAQQLDTIIAANNAEVYLADMRETVSALAVDDPQHVPVQLLLDHNAQAAKLEKVQNGLLTALRQKFPGAQAVLPERIVQPRYVAIGGRFLRGEFLPITSIGLSSAALNGLSAARIPKARVPKGATTFDWMLAGKVVAISLGGLAVGGFALSGLYWLTGSLRAAAAEAERRAEIAALAAQMMKQAYSDCLKLSGKSSVDCMHGALGIYARSHKDSYVPGAMGFTEKLGWIAVALGSSLAAYRGYVRYTNRRWPFESVGGGGGQSYRQLPAHDESDA